MSSLRVIELGIDHPHGEMYRTTLAHHPGFNLVGAWDAHPARAMAMLDSEGVDIPVSGDMDELLSSADADVVLITLPNNVTPAAITASARLGLHIFAEKPSATTAAAFLPAYEAVRGSGVRFASGYLRRFSPAAAALRDLIAEGMLGDLVSAQITFVTTNAALRNATYLTGRSIESVAGSGCAPAGDQPAGERHWMFDSTQSGGGIMHWLGVHWIDLLRFVTGDDFTHVSASLATQTTAPIDVEDVATVTLESASGLHATVACAYALPRAPDQVHIALQGTLGWVRWDGGGPAMHLHSSHPAWRAAPTRSLHFEADHVPGYSGALGWEAFEQLRSAILGEGQLPMDVNDALRTLQILDAIQLSGRERQRVAI